MDEEVVRKQVQKLRERALELGFKIQEITIGIAASSVLMTGDPIPQVIGKMWKVSIMLYTEINIK